MMVKCIAACPQSMQPYPRFLRPAIRQRLLECPLQHAARGRFKRREGLKEPMREGSGFCQCPKHAAFCAADGNGKPAGLCTLFRCRHRDMAPAGVPASNSAVPASRTGPARGCCQQCHAGMAIPVHPSLWRRRSYACGQGLRCCAVEAWQTCTEGMVGGDGAGQDVLGTEDAAAAARLQGGIAMEISGHDSVMTPEGVYIIGTYDENGVPNAMNATWGVQCGEGKIAFFLGTHKTPRISRPKAPSRFSLQRQTLSRSRTISALPRETS